MAGVLTPKGFLQIGGIVLVLIAVLGYVGVIGPTPEQSLFGGAWYFDNVENLAHFVLGVVALAAVYLLGAGLHKPLVMIVGIVAILVGVYSLIISDMLLGAGLENPADTILHLAVGAWALYASMKGGGGMAGSGMGGAM